MPPKKPATPAAAAPPPAPTHTEKDKKPPKGHKQKGAGAIIKSKGEVTVAGITMKEWERTPMTLLQDWVNHNKRPRPIYASMSGAGIRYKLILQDPKRPGSEKDLVFTPTHTFTDDLDAKHTIALLALHNLEPDRPHERKLPEPYRSLWMTLTGSGAPASASVEKDKDVGGGKGKGDAGGKGGRAAAAAAAGAAAAAAPGTGSAAGAAALTPAPAAAAAPVPPTAGAAPAGKGAAGSSIAPIVAPPTLPGGGGVKGTPTAAAGGTASAAAPAAAGTPPIGPPPKRIAANLVPMDVRLTSKVASAAERSRQHAERELARRERENRRRARKEAISARNRDAIVDMNAMMREMIENALRSVSHVVPKAALDAPDEASDVDAVAALVERNLSIRDAVDIPEDTQDEVEAELLEAEFTQEQAEAALEAVLARIAAGDTSMLASAGTAGMTGDTRIETEALTSACIDWLLLHTAEDKLPRKFVSRGPAVRLVKAGDTSSPTAKSSAPAAAPTQKAAPTPAPRRKGLAERMIDVLLADHTDGETEMLPGSAAELAAQRLNRSHGLNTSMCKAVIKALPVSAAPAATDEDMYVAAVHLVHRTCAVLAGGDKAAGSVLRLLPSRATLEPAAADVRDLQDAERMSFSAVFGEDFSCDETSVTPAVWPLTCQPHVPACAVGGGVWHCKFRTQLRDVRPANAGAGADVHMDLHVMFMAADPDSSPAPVAAVMYPRSEPACWVTLDVTGDVRHASGATVKAAAVADALTLMFVKEAVATAQSADGSDGWLYSVIQTFMANAAGVACACATGKDIEPEPATREEPATIAAPAVAVAEIASAFPAPATAAPPAAARGAPSSRKAASHGKAAFESHALRAPRASPALEATMAREDVEWQAAAKDKVRDPMWRSFQDVRLRLPVAGYKGHILDTVSKNQVILLSGETGCGKTTQVPQFILEDAIEKGRGGHTRIVVTQPRRLAATGVAKRVAEERVEPLGTRGGAVGYHIRGEKRAHPGTSLLFTTTGVLLRRLNSGLGHITHIIVDEVHERNIDTDFLLAVLRRVLRARRDIKVILMSATMDAAVFAKYFAEFAAPGSGMIPIVSVPGRTFPVREVYLGDILRMTGYTPSMKGLKAGADRMPDADDVDAFDDDADGAITPTATPSAARASAERGIDVDAHAWKRRGIDYALMAALITHICSPTERIARSGSGTADEPDDGSILVFMPGVPEIRKLQRQLERAGSVGHLHVLPLHGALSPDEQSRVFQRPPAGKRKVILATNVAETSITIDDVTVVVDSLRVKESQYEHASGTAKLVETWVSLAAGKQRRGRAGRVRPGVCYRVAPDAMMPLLRPQTIPEIQRTPLESLCLQVSLLQLGAVHDFMTTLMDPPSLSSVQNAIENLLHLGAYAAGSQAHAKWRNVTLTPLGYHLALLPVDVHLGKALIVACILRCVDPVLTIVAALSDRNPFRPVPFDMDEVERGRILDARKKLQWELSDHLTLARAFDTWQNCSSWPERREFCARVFIGHESMQTIQDLRKDYASVLADLGFLPGRRGGGGDDDARAADRRGRDAGDWGSWGERAGDMNVYSTQANVVTAALVAGLYPRVVKIVAPPRKYHETMSGAMPTDYKPTDLKLYTLLDRVAHADGTTASGSAVGAKSSGASSASVAKASRPDTDESSVDEEPEEADAPEMPAAEGRSMSVWNGFRQERVFLHPGSVNFSVGEYRSPWLVFHEKAFTSKTLVRDCSMAKPYALMLFGGPIHVDHQAEKITVGEEGWIQFHAEPRIGILVRQLRNSMNALLAAKIASPALDIRTHPVAEAIARLLITNGVLIP